MLGKPSSFTANFSFAFAIISTITSFLVTLFLTKAPYLPWIALAASVPGAAIAYALVGQTLRYFPRDQLYYGAATWTETWTEMLDAVFPRQNESFSAIDLEPVLTAAHQFATYLVPLLILIALWAALAAKFRPIQFVWLALIITLALHGLAHSFENLLLPKDRTSLFITFFLSLAAVYGPAAVSGAFARIAATSILCTSLATFSLAFRTNYFRIWDFDLDVDHGWAAFVRYARDHPVKSAACTWRYAGAYNFYRLASHAEISLPECEYIDQDHPPSRSAYFLNVPGQAEFIAKAKLRTIYQSPISGLVVGASVNVDTDNSH